MGAVGMYNPYIKQPTQSYGEEAERRPGPGHGPVGGIFDLFRGEQKDAGIAGILKSIGLEQMDTGDILLLLIILLLVLEGDGTEMAITLALMLLMGLGNGQEADQV